MAELITVHTKPCMFCRKSSEVVVDAKGFQRWAVDGEFIQKALPELSADNRELLMTGTCIECWDEQFLVEEEDEEE